MHWIFLSPHLDDAVLSCGGLMAEFVQAGDWVEVWTVCAGNPPPGPLSPLAQDLHQRWGGNGKIVTTRRAEDRQACARLGVTPRHFSIPDCIYRRNPISDHPLITTNDDLFQPLPEVEHPLVVKIGQKIKKLLPSDARLVSPLTLGNHVDHHLVRSAAEMISQPLWYYADYPYAMQLGTEQELDILTPVEIFHQQVSKSSLIQWQAAIAEYRSQISSFWESLNDMNQSIHSYWESGGGSRLWCNQKTT